MAKNEEEKSCDGCGFENPPDGIGTYPRHLQEGDKDLRVICANNLSGNLERLRDNHEVLSMIAYVGNAVIEEIRRVKGWQ